MARLGFLYAGGTIGCRGQPLAPVSGEEMHKAWATTEELPQPAQWLALDPAIDSSEATPTDWVRLMRGVLTLAERCDGVVVLHGTDTLAWSAAMLAYLSTLIGSDGVPMARLACPVVVTGAQRPLFDDDASLRAGSDAPANLTLAAAVAARPIPGCRVAFGGQIMAATRIVKVSTVADAAFACPNGDAEPDALPQAERAALRAQLDALEQSLSSRSVLAYTPAPAPAGAHAAVLEATVEALGGALAGIHLMGFGGGNMPNAALLEPVLAKAQTQGVLLAAGTQVGAGPVSSAYASGCWLADAGAWPTGTRTPAAVQTKLALVAALGRHHGWGRTEMRHAFDGAFAAEA